MIPVETKANVVLEFAQIQVLYWKEAQRGTPMSVHQRYRQALTRLRQDAQSVRLPKPVGERLVERGLVTAEALNRALENQSHSNPRKLVGEILMEQGVLQPEDLLATLHGAFNA